MSESIAQRVARLVSGGFNSIVDKVENSNPKLLLEQTIRELDSAIDDVRAELGQQIAQKHLVSKKLSSERSKYEELSNNLQVAINNNRDDLAGVAIEEQMDIEARIPILEKSIVESTDKEKELESFIQALQAKKRDMRAEIASLEKIQKDSGLDASLKPTNKTSKDKAQAAIDAFNRILEKNTNISSGTQNIQSAKKLAELEELARKNRVAERLAALKAGDK